MNLESMKRQTIGVEVEMVLDRGKAARVAGELFQRPETVDYIGGSYQEWQVRDNRGRVWKFKRDTSILAIGTDQCELVTPVLFYEDIPLLQELIRQLRKAGAKSSPDFMCGVHVHIGADGHTPATLRNLANLMASHEALLITALKLDQERIERYCSTVNPDFLRVLNQKKPTSMEKLADIWYKENPGSDWDRNWHYNHSRYHMLNLHSVFTKGTVEFRLFQFDEPSEGRKGGLHAGQLKSYIQLCLALSQQAKEARSCSPREPQRDNPKYAMRCWLLRLGFIGEEFETARDILTRNLTGDSAFRHGRPAA